MLERGSSFIAKTRFGMAHTRGSTMKTELAFMHVTIQLMGYILDSTFAANVVRVMTVPFLA